MPLIPHRFLFRVTLPCQHVPGIPLDGDRLLDLPVECKLESYADMDGKPTFADVRVGWNALGLGVQVEVRGKDRAVQGDASRPRASDGLTLWVDTRDARTSHRASRYCHQFHFLPTGGGPERDEAVFVQTKINRAQQDAPQAAGVPVRCRVRAGGYRLEAFLPAAALYGYDPEEHPRLGLAYLVRDDELGEQVQGVGSDFPIAEDPTLWGVLELVKEG